MRTTSLPLACGACLAVLALSAQAARYDVEDIGRAMPGAQVVPLAINQAGISVGDATRVDSFVQNAVLLGRGDVEVLPRTGTSSSASGINREGRVVGTMSFPPQQPDRRAFTSVKGETQRLGTLGGETSTGRAVNDAGQVVGGSTLKNGFSHAFLFEDGRMTDLGTLGGQTSEALAINPAGVVVGRAQLHDGDTHAFAWRKGTMIDLGTLGGDHAGRSSIASGVNASGVVTGQSSTAADAGLVHAVRWSADDGLQDLGSLPGGQNSFGLGVNGDGDIVGGSEIRGRVFHAFIVRARGHDKAGHGSERMTDLNDEMDEKSGEGWVLTAATAINDRGQIIGYGTRHGRPAAFLLTPK
jgi:probable HAF family extracellular repeat protein